MSLNASATSRCSLAPVTSARASSSPSSTRRAVLREPAQRPGERAGENPGEREPEPERRETDADHHEHVPAHPLPHLVDALGDAHGADRPAFVDDRHRGVEELTADGVTVARPLL